MFEPWLKRWALVLVLPKVSCRPLNSRHHCLMPDLSKGFRKGCYSECLTRDGSYVVYCTLDPKRNLASSTEAQEVLGITDDRPSARNAIDRESTWSWEKPASAGFFSSVEICF